MMESNHTPNDPREPFEEFDDLESSNADGGSSWPIVLALLVAVSLVGYVIFDGLEAETYFYTVDEAVAQGDDLVGQTVRIKGKVEPGSIEGEAGTLGRKFQVAEKGKTIWVTYDRALPDTFEEGVEVVAQGTVNDSYTLEADEVMVKCPSRYEGQGPHPEGISKEGPQAKR
ncbi:cytochrome c maturation protein CcmE [Persicimonas caeni]|nr:cytochrome c maturation protein CcmE [Persicimonas caeni]